MHRLQPGNAGAHERSGIDVERAVFQPQAKQVVGGPQHARCRTGIAGPAATSVVSCPPVHIRSLLVGRQAERHRVLVQGRKLAPDRPRLPAPLIGPRGISGALGVPTQTERGIDQPGRPVGVLAAVFPHTGRIERDTARIGTAVAIEGGIEQTDERRGFKAGQSRAQGGFGALGAGRSGNRRPGRHQGAQGRKRFAGIAGGAQEAVAQPAAGDRLAQPRRCCLITLRGRSAVDALGQGQEALQDIEQEQRHPHAFPTPMDAELIEAVIPVPGTDQRQAARTELPEAQVDGAPAVDVETVLIARDARHEGEIRPALGDRAAFEIGHLRVQ